MRLTTVWRSRLVCLFAIAAAVLGAADVFAQSMAWFGGGGYDGFDDDRIAGPPDYPRIHNSGGASNVTPVYAFLNGMLTATGTAPARVFVFWGLEDGGTNTGAWATHHAFGDFGDTPLFEPLTHEIAVTPDLFYYYRFFATNEAGETGWALASSSFQVPAPPVVTTDTGAGAGIQDAVLRGKLVAGTEATVWIGWGGPTSPEAEPAVWTAVSMGIRTVACTVQAPNPFQHTLSGLAPSTTYAYRVWAENTYGAATSPCVWFATAPLPLDFTVLTNQEAWFGGGSYDGYDGVIRTGIPCPGTLPGTLILIK